MALSESGLFSMGAQAVPSRKQGQPVFLLPGEALTVKFFINLTPARAEVSNAETSDRTHSRS